VRQHAVDRRALQPRDRVPEPELPQFPLPEGYDSDAEYLRALTYEGAHMRWGAAPEPEVRERIEYELTTIATMGYSSYFIITWDLIKHARDKDIRVGPGPGSAAGCAVAYCLRITELDPIATTCCSSGSSTRPACRCPTSTWTSTPDTGTR
jgi:DNA polymerase III alpha subunit